MGSNKVVHLILGIFIGGEMVKIVDYNFEVKDLLYVIKIEEIMGCKDVDVDFV